MHLGTESVEEELSPADPEDRPNGCPDCAKRMRPVRLETSLVVLDHCPDHGLWFDRDELDQVAAEIGRRRSSGRNRLDGGMAGAVMVTELGGMGQGGGAADSAGGATHVADAASGAAEVAAEAAGEVATEVAGGVATEVGASLLDGAFVVLGDILGGLLDGL